MASIHRRPKSKFWHAAWRDASGKLHFRSTKQTVRLWVMRLMRRQGITADSALSNEIAKHRDARLPLKAGPRLPKSWPTARHPANLPGGSAQP